MLESMDEVHPLPVNLLERKTFIQTELLRFLEDKELYTKFFHRMANGKKRKKKAIFCLQHNGSQIEDRNKSWHMP